MKLCVDNKKKEKKMSTHAHDSTITYGSNTESEREDERLRGLYSGRESLPLGKKRLSEGS